MTLKITLTRHAEHDLLDIWAYIADDNPDAADKLLAKFESICQTLAQQPHSGRPRDELAPELRSMPVGRYIVFYRPDFNGITVIRVLHGARDLPKLL